MFTAFFPPVQANLWVIAVGYPCLHLYSLFFSWALLFPFVAFLSWNVGSHMDLSSNSLDFGWMSPDRLVSLSQQALSPEDL